MRIVADTAAGAAATVPLPPRVTVTVTVTACIGNAMLTCRVADTPAAQAAGLEHVAALSADEGMLFPIDPPRVVSVRAGRVSYPFDIIFVRRGPTPDGLRDRVADAGGALVVAHVVARVPPGALGTWSANEVVAIVEAPGGWCEAHGVHTGALVLLKGAGARGHRQATSSSGMGGREMSSNSRVAVSRALQSEAHRRIAALPAQATAALPLFAYGTFRAGGSNHWRLGGARTLGVARLPRYRRADEDGPILIPDPTGYVLGELYAVPAYAFQRLDEYERPSHVRRKVRLDDGREVWVYVSRYARQARHTAGVFEAPPAMVEAVVIRTRAVLDSWRENRRVTLMASEIPVDLTGWKYADRVPGYTAPPIRIELYGRPNREEGQWGSWNTVERTLTLFLPRPQAARNIEALLEPNGLARRTIEHELEHVAQEILGAAAGGMAGLPIPTREFDPALREFYPLVRDEVQRFRRYLVPAEPPQIHAWVASQPFFQKLRAVDPKLWQKAVKLFATEVQSSSNKAAALEPEDMPAGRNPDGSVTVYHATTAAAAQDILRERRLRSKGEPEVFCSSTPEGVAGEYGDGTVVAFDIDPRRLTLHDEFPGGRKDYSIPARSLSTAIRNPRIVRSPRTAVAPAPSLDDIDWRPAQPNEEGVRGPGYGDEDLADEWRNKTLRTDDGASPNRWKDRAIGPQGDPNAQGDADAWPRMTLSPVDRPEEFDGQPAVGPWAGPSFSNSELGEPGPQQPGVFDRGTGRRASFEDRVMYHGSRDGTLTELDAFMPHYEGGIGHGVYVAPDQETAEFYGPYVYAVRLLISDEQILWLTPDTVERPEAGAGHSMLVGEHIEPFSFEIGEQTYTVGSDWLIDQVALSRFHAAAATLPLPSEIASYIARVDAIPDLKYDLDDMLMRSGLAERWEAEGHNVADDAVVEQLAASWIDTLTSAATNARNRAEAELGLVIDLEDIGGEASAAGYRAVYLEGVRDSATVNDELLVFDSDDLQMIGLVDEKELSRHPRRGVRVYAQVTSEETPSKPVRRYIALGLYSPGLLPDIVQVLAPVLGEPAAGQRLLVRLEMLRPALVSAAQTECDAWQPDMEEGDPEVGFGGICDRVSSAMAAVLSEAGIDTTEGGQEGDDHAWLIAYDDATREAVGVDIAPGVYERGGGYSWSKIEGARIEPGDVAVWPISYEDARGSDERTAAGAGSIWDPAEMVTVLLEGGARLGSTFGLTWTPDVLNGKATESAKLDEETIRVWAAALDELAPGAREVLAETALTEGGLQTLADGLVFAGVAHLARIRGRGLRLWRGIGREN